jgi:hypothetical protein
MSTIMLPKGTIPALGTDHQLSLVIGWTAGDGNGHAGYQASDYFDLRGRYLGSDEHGIEPIFREMDSDEVTEYLAQEAGYTGPLSALTTSKPKPA